ncbi:MAG: ROK family protein, partial [Candidatus Limnocylindrales bacterium]
ERAPGPLEGRDVADAAAEGDAVAAAIIDRARAAFAAFVVSLVDVFAPERIVVGGGVAIADGERLLGAARAAVRAHGFRIPSARVEIVPAELGADVGLIGAVALLDLEQDPVEAG